MELRKLTDIEIGTVATIDSFTDEETSILLLEMGCLPGESIEISNIAPLGDPIAIKVSGYKLRHRKKETTTILVR